MMNPLRRQSCPSSVVNAANFGAGNGRPTTAPPCAAPTIITNSNSSSSSSSITVAVRVRPLSKKEIENGTSACVHVDTASKVVVIKKYADALNHLKSQMGSVHDYAFDQAFGEQSTQTEVFEKTTKPYLPNLLTGLNVTVFAYGATGAGKTHTMLGNSREDSSVTAADQNDLQESGIIPMAVMDLFNLIASKQKSQNHHYKTEIIASYIEVYNEQVYDLLTEPGSSGKPLNLREDTERGIMQIAGVAEIQVSSAAEVMNYLHHGNKNRKTETTMANQVSSRSHAVFQLLLKQKKMLECGRETIIESKLSLIDLAGSERASATNNRGIRLQEGANINKSLLALANCINALAANSDKGDQSKKEGFVKYRDSKLTHLLKSSLEGNCNLVMIANINPSNFTYEDSHNTLKYANRAKNIKVNPIAKENVSNGNWLEREKKLREENKYLRNQVETLTDVVSILQNRLNFLELNAQKRFQYSNATEDNEVSTANMVGYDVNNFDGNESINNDADADNCSVESLQCSNGEKEFDVDVENCCTEDDLDHLDSKENNQNIFSSVDEYIQSQHPSIGISKKNSNVQSDNIQFFVRRNRKSEILNPPAASESRQLATIPLQLISSSTDDISIIREISTSGVQEVDEDNSAVDLENLDAELIIDDFNDEDNCDDKISTGSPSLDDYDQSDDESVGTIDSAIERMIPSNYIKHHSNRNHSGGSRGLTAKRESNNRKDSNKDNNDNKNINSKDGFAVHNVVSNNNLSNNNDNEVSNINNASAQEVFGPKYRKKSMETINSMLSNLGLSRIGNFTSRQPVKAIQTVQSTQSAQSTLNRADKDREKENLFSNSNPNPTPITSIPKDVIAAKKVPVSIIPTALAKAINSNNPSAVNKDTLNAKVEDPYKTAFRPSKLLNLPTTASNNTSAPVEKAQIPLKAPIPSFKKIPNTAGPTGGGGIGIAVVGPSGIVAAAAGLGEKPGKDKTIHSNAWSNF